jgi:predicted chitinase
MAGEKESIFDFADKFGIDSPFGNWVKEDIKTVEQGAEIIDISISSDNNNPALYLIKKPDIVNTALIFSVTTKGSVEWVKADMSGKVLSDIKLVRSDGKNNVYEIRHIVSVAKSKAAVNQYNIKTFKFNVWVSDAILKRVTDSRSTQFTIDTSGKIVSGKIIEEDELKKNCFCKKTTFSADDLNYIVSWLRKKDDIIYQTQYDERGNPLFIDQEGNILKSNDRGKSPKPGAVKYKLETSFYDRNDSDNKPVKDRLFFYKSDGFNLKSTSANYSSFALALNKMFSQYKINTCLRKIHFLAQIYVETNRFRTTYEAEPKDNYSGGTFYRGRGMKQITHDYNYLEYYDYKKKTTFFSTYINKRNDINESVNAFNKRTNNQYISIEQMKKIDDFAKLLSTDINYACDSAGWYWNKANINAYADKDDIINVSAKVNNPSAVNTSSTEKINGYKERKLYYDLLKIIFNYNECK